MTERAEHVLRYDDGRSAKHPFFKFVVHNLIMRQRALHIQTKTSHFLIRDLEKNSLKMVANQYVKKVCILEETYREQLNIGDEGQNNY